MSSQPIPINKPESAWVAVDPGTAKRWLERNVKNRALRQRSIDAFARDMAAGKWRLTGEAVKFAPDGTLLDGQHRLAAVVQSGCTITMLVVRNVPSDAQAVMDTGATRTASDVLTLEGQKNSSILAAAARLGLVIANDFETGLNVTHSEIMEWIGENPGIHRSCELAREVSRRVDCPPAVVAYTHHVLSLIDPFDATNFWISAAEKAGLQIGDPVIALTNRFAEARRNREHLSRRIYVSLIYRAWNTRRQGKTMRFIRVNSPAGGLVPVPEPK